MKNTEWVLVETVQMFRMRYMVEVNKNEDYLAAKIVMDGDAKEFSQQPMEEIFFSQHTMTEKQALELCDKDNNGFADWPKAKKLNAFFTKIGQKGNTD